MKTTNITVLVSGGGTNLQALLDAQDRGELGGGVIRGVVSSKAGACALRRAEQAGIPAAVICRRDYPDSASFDRALLEELDRRGTELVVLAGYLSILGNPVVERYRRRILNVHPSLIPSFCGEGYYGLRVHQAALDYGVKVTGATVHFVSEVVDGGEIVLQKAVEVLPEDTPEALQQRVMREAEWELLPRAVSLFCQGKL